MQSPSRLVLTSLALVAGLSFACSDSGDDGGAIEGGGGNTAVSSSSQAGSTSSSASGGSSSAGGASSSSSSSSVSSGGSTSTSSSKTATSTGTGGSTKATSTATSEGGSTANTSTGGRTGGSTKTGGTTGTATGGAGGTSKPEGGTTSTGSTGKTGGSTSTVGTNTKGSGGYLVPPKKYFGNIDTRGAIRSDFKSMWDQFSPENAGKWGSVQGGGQNSFSWNTLDTMYKYCNDNGIIFKQHTFCWGAQQPNWVNNTNGEAAVKAWMKAFCERYPKTVMIDVFNESLHNSPAYKNGIGGTGTTGYDWLVNAFKWAREACPTQILLYNDYNTIEYASENTNVIKLVNAIKNAGAPIDGVGCQAHDVGLVSAATVKNYIDKIIKETGLPVYITELDVGKADDAQQLASIKGIVEPYWNHEMVLGWTYWGYLEGATWRSNTHLLKSNGTQRAALTWILDFTKH